MPAISTLILVLGALLAVGNTVAQVRDNSRRIEAMEKRVDQINDRYTEILQRLARIEGKVDDRYTGAETRP